MSTEGPEDCAKDYDFFRNAACIAEANSSTASWECAATIVVHCSVAVVVRTRQCQTCCLIVAGTLDCNSKPTCFVRPHFLHLFPVIHFV